jgi:hypothetical protein
VKPRMKLAEGSRWVGPFSVGGPIRNGIHTATCIDLDNELLLNTSDEQSAWCKPQDALAVIDAAGLDKVRAASRELRKAFTEMPTESHVNPWDYLGGSVVDLLAALDKETETDAK